MSQCRPGPSKGSRRNVGSQRSQESSASQNYPSSSSHHSQTSSHGEGSSSQSSQPTAISTEGFDSLVNDVVQYLLVQDHHKHAIKQVDIKNVMKLHSKRYKEVMDKAKDVLDQTFGFRLVEVEPGTYKSFILVNKFRGCFSTTEKQDPQLMLLLFVLSLIFMRGGSVTDDEMWKFLSQAKILQEGGIHSYFGDVKKLMTQELVRQLYLKYIRIPDTDPTKYEFRWGRRAEEEMDKKVPLQFVGKVYGQEDLSVWTAQYEEANEQGMHN